MAVSRDEMREVEAGVRTELSRVRLIAELDLDVEGELFRRAFETLCQHLRANPGHKAVAQLPQTYPAVFAFVLTALGQFVGGADEYWQKIQEGRQNEYEIPGLTGTNSNQFGKAFRESIKVLGLPEFSHIFGRVNLVPLLLHGAIPAKDINQVWHQVAASISNGMESGEEIVASWRSDPAQLQYMNKPVVRFIQESGRFADDIVQRMVNALIDLSIQGGEIDPHEMAQRHRLPSIYFERLNSDDVGGVSRRVQIPNPTIFIDRFAGMGPELRLPALREELQDAQWVVTSAETRTYRASHFDERHVVLGNEPRWAYELIQGGERLKFREFSQFGAQKIWAFSRHGDEFQLRDIQGGLDNEIVYLLAPINSKVFVKTSGDITKSESFTDFITFGDDWSNYTLFELDLTLATSVEVEFADKTIEHPVLDSPPRPSIEGIHLENLREIDGRRVFVSEPRLKFSKAVERPDLFTVEIRYPDSRQEENLLSTLRLTDEGYEIAPSTLRQSGRYQVRLRGQLGSELSEEFVLLRDVTLSGSDGIFGPHDIVDVDILVAGNRSGVVSIPAQRSRAVFRLSGGTNSEDVHLVVSIKRVAFGVSADENLHLDSAVKECTREDFLYDSFGWSTKILAVRTCMPHGAALIWSTDSSLLSRREIKGPLYKVPLANFRDDVIGMNSPSAELQLLIPGLAPITLLTIGTRRTDAIEHVYADGSHEGKVTSLVMQFSEGIAKFVRFVELVSLTEPWRPTFRTQMLSLDEKFRSAVTLARPLSPGSYQVQAFGDTGSRTTLLGETSVNLGTASDLKEYFERLGNTNEDLLTRVLRRGSKVLNLTEVQYLETLDEVIDFLLTNIQKSEMKKECDAARELLLTEGCEEILLNSLSEKLGSASQRKDLEVLIIRFFPFMCDALRGAARNLKSETISRIWRASPLVGAILKPHKFFSSSEGEVLFQGIDAVILREEEYWLGTRCDFVDVVRETHFRLENDPMYRESLEEGHTNLLGTESLKHALCHLKGFLLGLDVAETPFEAQARKLLSGLVKYRGPMTREVQVDVFGRRPSQSDLRFASYINYLFGLTKYMLDPEVSYDKSTAASNLLSSQYHLTKPIVQRVLLETVVPND